MQDHQARFAGKGTDFGRFRAGIGAFKIGDTDVKLARCASDCIGQFAGQLGRHGDFKRLVTCGQFGPDPFVGHMHRDGGNNPVRVMRID